MNFLKQLQQQKQKQKQKQIQVCHQYLLISPSDHKNWNKIKEQLEILSKDYLSDKLIKFLEGNYGKRGYKNIRLAKRIRTQYFWYHTVQFMLQCVARDSQLLESAISVLISQQDTLIKLTKYQIFLIMCHLFFGTFPDQLYKKQVSFSSLMTLYDDEDQTTDKTKTTLRLNKLKAIARYFCLFNKRSRDSKYSNMKNQIVAFQRFKLKDSDTKTPQDNIKFCNVEVKIGEYYLYQNQINTININSVKNSVVAIPGFEIYNNLLDFEQKIFISHPQMLVLKILMYQPLEKYESLIIHGAQKYSSLNQVNDSTPFNFMQSFRDQSKISKIYNGKITSFIFVNREKNKKDLKDKKDIKDKKGEQIIFKQQIFKVFSGIKACHYLHSKKQKLISGYFHAGKNRKEQFDWVYKFLIDWLAASLANWETLTFYVQDQNQAVNLKILVKQLKDHTIRDIISIIDSYNDFKTKDNAKITLLRFLKQFVL